MWLSTELSLIPPFNLCLLVGEMEVISSLLFSCAGKLRLSMHGGSTVPHSQEALA